jgi:hypothetical protein
MKLFATAFLQVFLVSANTLFIARLFWPGIIIASFGISFFWSGNVKRIAIGNLTDRIIYSYGAMAGGVVGVLTANLINYKL